MKHNILIFAFAHILAVEFRAQFALPQVAYPEKPKVKDCFSFRELNDEQDYANAVKFIQKHATIKKAPFYLKNTVFFNPSLQFKLIDSALRKKKVKLESLKYYIDTNAYKINEPNGETREQEMVMYSQLPYELIFRPFYILNSGVSNAEYAEFTRFVIDSIARTLLARSLVPDASDYGYADNENKLHLKYKKKINWWNYSKEFTEAVLPLYLPEGERFYRRKEIDWRKHKWAYALSDNTKLAICVYPDTLRWLLDFNNRPPCIFEPQSNMYFWHPAFADHPVVGLTWVQVKAFLLWKTRRLQKELDEKKIPYLVEFDLPTEIELEMIVISRSMDEKRPNKYRAPVKFKYKDPGDYNLIIEQSAILFSAMKKFPARSGVYDLMLNACDKASRFNILSFPTLPEKMPKKRMKDPKPDYTAMMDEESPKYLNSNVSEWMKESLYCTDYYQENVGGKSKSVDRKFQLYDSLFPVRGNLENYYRLKEKVSYRAEQNFFSDLSRLFNPPDKIGHDPCKLIRGCNWLDPVDPGSEIVRKNFSPVDSSYSTVGFRYVVRFRHK